MKKLIVSLLLVCSAFSSANAFEATVKVANGADLKAARIEIFQTVKSEKGGVHYVTFKTVKVDGGYLITIVAINGKKI